MTLSSNVKLIKSRSELKTVEHSFGEYFGFGLKSIIKTESAFADFRTVMEKAKMYNYNPMNIMRFGWASGAISENGQPSLRKHEVQLTYDPSSSSTKEVRINLQVTYGYKPEGESVKVPHIELGRNGLKLTMNEAREAHHQKVGQLLEQSQLESGAGINIRMSTTIKGRVQRTWTCSLAAVTGMTNLKQKWNLHLESENTGNKVCINGQIVWPSSLPVWKMSDLESNNFRFRYENVIGFGRNCEESQIKIEGSSQVSEQQKKYARESAQAKLYKQLKNKNSPMAELSDAAEQLRAQQSQLDEVDFQIKYNNVPRKVMIISEYATEFLKGIWWPNLAPSTSEMSGRNDGDKVSDEKNIKILFNTATQTFDLFIRQSSGKTVFKHVRIPYPLNFVFPLPATREGVLGLTNSLVGKSFYPKCQIEGQHIRTFDNRSASMHIDNCYHLLAGDCSPRKQFGVLVRQSSAQASNKDVKVFLGKTEILLTPSQRHSSYDNSVRVVVNGSPIELQKNEKKTIRGSDSHIVAEIKETEDGVVILESKNVNIVYNGFKVQVEASYLQKNRLCGLCGDLNGQQQADLRGPRECIYSEPEVFAASYRVQIQGEQCQELSNHIQQKLQSEKKQCVKYREIPTKVMNAFKSQNGGRCTIHHHELIEKRGQLCFSRKPVIECGASCRAESMVEKKISFGCLPKDSRITERYAEKVQRGEVVPELESLPEDFKSTRTLPKSCVPVRQQL
jgi:hypothetical protein